MWSNDLGNNSISSFILVTDITDHLPCITVDSTRSQESGYRHYSYRCITDKNRENFVKRVKQAKDALEFHTHNSRINTQTKYADYFAHLTRIYDEEFPIKRKKIHVKTVSKPWINTDLLRLIKKKNALFGKKLRSNHPAHAAQKYRECKKDLLTKLKQAKQSYYHRKLYEENSTMKQKWDCICTLIQRKKQSSNFCPIDNETLGSHYSTVAEKLCQNMDIIQRDDIPHSSTKHVPYSNKRATVSEPFIFNKITEREVYESILKLDQNKGPGLDGLDIKSIKSIANIISPQLCTLFNLSIQYSEYPDTFKIAKCVPIFKGNPLDPYKPINYRPISILNCLNKTLEKLLHDQIYTFLEANNIIPDFQFGYRKNRNTNQAILKLNDIIETNKLDKTVSIAIFMDLSKAFDTVDKDILCTKLNNIGFSTNSNNLIYDYMSKRKFCMKNDTLFKNYSLDYGVPQGSILGPLLFVAYMHDMDSFCEHVEKIVYADDTTAIVTGRNLREAKEHANDILQQFYNYFTFNKLTVNENKTKYMVYDFRSTKEKNKDTNKTELLMNETVLEEIEKICFLGVIMNNKLTWNDHKSHIKGKVNKALGIIYNTRNILKHSHLINIYNTFIQPYFSYCISIWGSSVRSETDETVKLQNKTLRILFSCKRSKDAWDDNGNNMILPIQQLYLLDISKLCYQHHTKLLPNNLISIMPDILNDDVTHRKTRSKTNHNYRYNYKIKKTLPKECISLWNKFPTEIKNMAYNNSSTTKEFVTI